MKHLGRSIFWTMALGTWFTPAFAITTTLTKVTPDKPVTNSTEITFEFVTDTSDAHFMCSLDYKEASHCDSPITYRGLADGKHHFQVNAVSPSVGADRIAATYDWVVDTVPPSTTLKTAPSGPDGYMADIFSSEPRSTYACSVDGSPAFSCRTPYMLTGFLPGNHDFKAFAIDEAGNVDPVGADFPFAVHSHQPLTTSITNVDPTSTYTNITHIDFDFVSSQPASTFVCTLAGSSTNCIPPYGYASLPDGDYTFKVQAVDAFGVMDPVGALYSWTVDTTPPIPALENLDSTSTIVTVTWTTNEPATTEMHWGMNQDVSRPAPGSSLMTTTHTVRVSGLSSNTPYSFQPGGVDRAGNPYQMNVLAIRTKR